MVTYTRDALESRALESGDPGRPIERELPFITTLAELTVLSASTQGILLRYSTGPDADTADCRSRDCESGVVMPGISVTALTPEAWWPRPAEEWIARRIGKYAALGRDPERFAWLLTGTVVGHGPDHEPLVAQIRPLARLHPDVLEEARRLYEERFVGGGDPR